MSIHIKGKAARAPGSASKSLPALGYRQVQLGAHCPGQPYTFQGVGDGDAALHMIISGGLQILTSRGSSGPGGQDGSGKWRAIQASTFREHDCDSATCAWSAPQRMESALIDNDQFHVRLMPHLASKFKPGWIVDVAVEAMDAELERALADEGPDHAYVEELLQEMPHATMRMHASAGGVDTAPLGLQATGPVLGLRELRNDGLKPTSFSVLVRVRQHLTAGKCGTPVHFFPLGHRMNYWPRQSSIHEMFDSAAGALAAQLAPLDTNALGQNAKCLSSIRMLPTKPAGREQKEPSAPSERLIRALASKSTARLYRDPNLEDLLAKRGKVEATAREEAEAASPASGPWYEASLLRQGEERGALAVGWVRIVNYRRQPPKRREGKAGGPGIDQVAPIGALVSATCDEALPECAELVREPIKYRVSVYQYNHGGSVSHLRPLHMSKQVTAVQPVGEHYVDVPIHAPGEVIRVELLEPQWACLVLDELEPYCGCLHGATAQDDVANALDFWQDNPMIGRRALLPADARDGPGTAAAGSGKQAAVHGPNGEQLGEYEYMKGGEFRAGARRLASGLEALLPPVVTHRGITAPRSERGAEMSDRIFLGICGENSAEWFMSWAAALHCGFVEVPMQHTMLRQQLSYIADSTGMLAAVVDAARLPMMKQVAADAPRLSLLVVVDTDLGVPSNRVVPAGVEIEEQNAGWVYETFGIPGGESGSKAGASSGAGVDSGAPPAAAGPSAGDGTLTDGNGPTILRLSTLLRLGKLLLQRKGQDEEGAGVPLRFPLPSARLLREWQEHRARDEATRQARIATLKAELKSSGTHPTIVPYKVAGQMRELNTGLTKPSAYADVFGGLSNAGGGIPVAYGQPVSRPKLLTVVRTAASDAASETTDAISLQWGVGPGMRDAGMILFTSGSTGNPKGVVESYKRGIRQTNDFMSPSPAYHSSFQPMSHGSEHAVAPGAIVSGATLGLPSSEPWAELYDDVRCLEPTFLNVVPSFFSGLHAEYKSQLMLAGVSASIEGAATGKSAEAAKKAAEERLKKEFSQCLGRRLRSVGIGSAPVPPAVLAWMRETWTDSIITEGYGASESGSITMNDRPIEGVELKIIDVPELGYKAAGIPKGQNPRGEVLVKTSTMVEGYFRNDAATDKAFDEEGYFRTGDLCELLPDGRIKLIGRRKFVKKLSNGEFVSPEKVETVLQECDLVHEVYVHAGDAAASLVAVVVPDLDIVKSMAGAAGAASSGHEESKQADDGDAHFATDSPMRSAGVAEVVRRRLAEFGQAKGLAPYELPSAVFLEFDCEFTSELGLRTTSNKKSRAGLIRRYGPTCDGLLQGRHTTAVAVGGSGSGAGSGGSKVGHPGDGVAEPGAAVPLSSEDEPADEIERMLCDAIASFVGHPVTPSERIWEGQVRSSAARTALKQRLLQAFAKSLERAGVSMASLGDLEQTTQTIRDVARILRGGAPTGPHPQVEALREDLRKARAAGGGPDGRGTAGGQASAGSSSARPKLADAKHVFLTGATGFLGVHLLDQLLDLPSRPTVHCLVRVSRGGLAKARPRAGSTGGKEEESKVQDGGGPSSGAGAGSSSGGGEGPPMLRRESSEFSHHARAPQDDEGEGAMLGRGSSGGGSGAMGKSSGEGGAASGGTGQPPRMERTKSADHPIAAQVLAQQRLEETASVAGVQLGFERAGRVVAVPGDLGKERFGMTAEAFDALASRVDGVVHCGAVVHWLKSYSDLRGPNVGGTEWAIRLAESPRKKPFVYVSTVSTVDTWSSRDKGKETDLMTDAQLCDIVKRSGYGPTKAVGERLVLAAASTGLPATIVRPGFIGGHSSSGHSNPSDFIHRYLAACVRMRRAIATGLQPGWCWEQTPVDFVARACIALGDASAPGQGLSCPCFHVCNRGGTISVGDIAAAITEDAGYADVRAADYPEFRARLLADCGNQTEGDSEAAGKAAGKAIEMPSMEGPNPLHTLLHMFQADSCGLFSSGRGRTDAGDAALAALGMRAPKVSKGMIASAVQSLARRGFVRAPGPAAEPSSVRADPAVAAVQSIPGAPGAAPGATMPSRPGAAAAGGTMRSKTAAPQTRTGRARRGQRSPAKRRAVGELGSARVAAAPMMSLDQAPASSAGAAMAAQEWGGGQATMQAEDTIGGVGGAGRGRSSVPASNSAGLQAANTGAESTGFGGASGGDSDAPPAAMIALMRSNSNRELEDSVSSWMMGRGASELTVTDRD